MLNLSSWKRLRIANKPLGFLYYKLSIFSVEFFQEKLLRFDQLLVEVNKIEINLT